jgi:hypothetical protein
MSKKPTNLVKLSTALQLQKDAGVKVETLAVAFACSPSRMYEVVTAGEWDERFADINHALRTLPSSAADAVLGVVLDGTSYAVPARADASCDFNGDGRCDHKDLGPGSGKLAERMGHWQQQALTGVPFSEAESADLKNDLAEIRRIADGLEKLVGRLTLGPRAAAG